MACWRVLELAGSERVPQLLIKPKFTKDSYTVFLTDLSSIWSEELDLTGIVERTSQQESPIEVSKQDTSQLAILLDTVRDTLTGAENASCHLVRCESDGLALHTSVALPEPLGSLTWKFELRKRTPIALKNELILPLLVSSFIQHGRVHSLTTLIDEKDKVITRLVDQFEASNLDLATAFPSVGGSKAGRKLVKREQAAKQIPALRPFERGAWKAESGELHDVDLTSFGLFQEALSECTSKVPSYLESKEDQDPWWANISTSLQTSRTPPATRQKLTKKALRKSPPPQEPSDDETEDEFETHEHFYQREAAKDPPPKSPSPQASNGEATDDEDLDAPPRSQSQKYAMPASPDRSTNAESRSHRSPPPGPATTKKTKGFKIGGARAKTFPHPVHSPAGAGTHDEPIERVSTSAGHAQATGKQVSPATPTKTRKTFKIGGKSKGGPSVDSTAKETRGLEERVKEEDDRGLVSASLANDRSTVNAATQDQKASTHAAEIAAAEEEHEETPEEKAERRRRELKRRNEEELAKKQAQKKKKRF